MSSLLYAVSSTDPALYAGTAAILIAMGALASYLPARRASRCEWRRFGLRRLGDSG
jgi:ABC-type antimicrobial peptide transport system permease subunit